MAFYKSFGGFICQLADGSRPKVKIRLLFKRRVSNFRLGLHVHRRQGLQQAMGIISCKNLITILLPYSSFCLVFCAAIDTITPTQFIKDPGWIMSDGSVFKLGFFSPAGSTNRYVGIWYNEISVPTVIWVANRDKPLKDSSGIVTISEGGDLLVLNGNNKTLWSSNISNTATNASAQLLDSGNLVLREGNSSNGGNDGRIIWESFQHPTDSFLQKMKFSFSKTKTGENQVLRSWKSPSDPSVGSFSAGGDPLKLLEIFIWNGSRIYWRSGPWNGQIFVGILVTNPEDRDKFHLVYDKDEESGYVTLPDANDSFSLNYVLNSQGKFVLRRWDDGKKNWENLWLAPETECGVFSKCGEFGSCNSRDSPICSCLRGFEPKNNEEWSTGNWTAGCVRRTQLQCERIRTGGEEGKEDGFLKLKKVKVPYSAVLSSVPQDECESQCLKNCSCLAYAYDIGIGCMSWTGKLIDIQELPYRGADLYLRVANSELDKKRDIKVIITTGIIVTVIIAFCIYFSWMWMAKRRARPSFSDDNMLGASMNRAKLQEVQQFNFEQLAVATNNFDIANKLGQGGFVLYTRDNC